MFLSSKFLYLSRVHDTGVADAVIRRRPFLSGLSSHTFLDTLRLEEGEWEVKYYIL